MEKKTFPKFCKLMKSNLPKRFFFTPFHVFFSLFVIRCGFMFSSAGVGGLRRTRSCPRVSEKKTNVRKNIVKFKIGCVRMDIKKQPINVLASLTVDSKNGGKIVVLQFVSFSLFPQYQTDFCAKRKRKNILEYANKESHRNH